MQNAALSPCPSKRSKEPSTKTTPYFFPIENSAEQSEGYSAYAARKIPRARRPANFVLLSPEQAC